LVVDVDNVSDAVYSNARNSNLLLIQLPVTTSRDNRLKVKSMVSRILPTPMLVLATDLHSVDAKTLKQEFDSISELLGIRRELVLPLSDKVTLHVAR
jgi:hypothetical protein